MQRPILSTGLSEAEFERWYWLRSELQAFCRAQGVSAAGPKQELAARIAALLSSRPHDAPSPKRTQPATMPSTFTPNTVIGSGWRCSQDLRRFFQSHVGTTFTFNEPLRTFLKFGTGRTLAEALAHYKGSLVAGPRPIDSHFEYNNHMREYRRSHPSSTHAEAVSAWWVKRGKPRKAQPIAAPSSMAMPTNKPTECPIANSARESPKSKPVVPALSPPTLK